MCCVREWQSVSDRCRRTLCVVSEWQSVSDRCRRTLCFVSEWQSVSDRCRRTLCVVSESDSLYQTGAGGRYVLCQRVTVCIRPVQEDVMCCVRVTVCIRPVQEDVMCCVRVTVCIRPVKEDVRYVLCQSDSLYQTGEGGRYVLCQSDSLYQTGAGGRYVLCQRVTVCIRPVQEDVMCCVREWQSVSDRWRRTLCVVSESNSLYQTGSGGRYVLCQRVTVCISPVQEDVMCCVREWQSVSDRCRRTLCVVSESDSLYQTGAGGRYVLCQRVTVCFRPVQEDVMCCVRVTVCIRPVQEDVMCCVRVTVCIRPVQEDVMCCVREWQSVSDRCRRTLCVVSESDSLFQTGAGGRYVLCQSDSLYQTGAGGRYVLCQRVTVCIRPVQEDVMCCVRVTVCIRPVQEDVMCCVRVTVCKLHRWRRTLCPVSESDSLYQPGAGGRYVLCQRVTVCFRPVQEDVMCCVREWQSVSDRCRMTLCVVSESDSLYQTGAGGRYVLCQRVTVCFRPVQEDVMCCVRVTVCIRPVQEDVVCCVREWQSVNYTGEGGRYALCQRVTVCIRPVKEDVMPCVREWQSVSDRCRRTLCPVSESDSLYQTGVGGRYVLCQRVTVCMRPVQGDVMCCDWSGWPPTDTALDVKSLK